MNTHFYFFQKNPYINKLQIKKTQIFYYLLFLLTSSSLFDLNFTFKTNFSSFHKVFIYGIYVLLYFLSILNKYSNETS